MLTSDLRYEVSRTQFGAEPAAGDVRSLFANLEQQAVDRLRSWFDGPILIERSVEMRYGAQIYEIDVLLDAVDWQSPSLIEQIEERFHDRHEELYTYASRDQETVFVNARVTAIGKVPKSGQGQVPATVGSRCIPRTTRKAFFGEWHEIPVYSFGALERGHVVDGPAIVEAETTTVVINSGDGIAVNDLGWLDIQVR